MSMSKFDAAYWRGYRNGLTVAKLGSKYNPRLPGEYVIEEELKGVGYEWFSVSESIGTRAEARKILKLFKKDWPTVNYRISRIIKVAVK